jgi:MipA family protein
MKTLLALSLVGACGAVSAQTPASNPMPDGSRDTYIGLGIVTAPEYPGARKQRVSALPLIQIDASNGIFITGMSAGIHLSRTRSVEFGPLLTVHPGRDASGDGGKAGGVTDQVQGFGIRAEEHTLIAPDSRAARPVPHGLDGMTEVKARLQGGMFANVYLQPDVRLTSSILYGAGNGRDGLAASFGIQRLATEIAPHHTLTLSAGFTVVNRRHNESFFGVNEVDAANSGYATYAPRGGVRDVYVGAGWNWALSPSWIVTSGARLTVLQGDARNSPLVRRAGALTVTTGLAYRF